VQLKITASRCPPDILRIALQTMLTMAIVCIASYVLQMITLSFERFDVLLNKNK